MTEAASSLTPPAFPTGWGKDYTHSLTRRDGTPNPKPYAGTPYPAITGAEIARMAANPQACDKLEAQWAIPSTYLECDARDHEPQALRGQFRMLVLDVDKNNLDLSFILECVAGVLGAGRSIIAYSTRSSTPSDRRWRVLIPLAEALAGADYHDTALAFFALLEDQSKGTLIVDPPAARFGQIFFLPNRGEHYEYELVKGSRAILAHDHPVIVRREQDRAKRAEAEAAAQARRKQREAERAARPFGDGESPVEAFNARHAVADLLERYGYTRAGHSDDWRSPYQTSKSFATKDYGDYWVSLSGSDASAGLGAETRSGARHGDAFDIYCHFEHGGNQSKAAKAYWAELNPSLTIAGGGRGTFAIDLGAASTRGDGRHLDAVDGDALEPVVPEPETAPPATALAEQPQFVKGKGGRPIWCADNACLTLEHHQEWQGVLAFDEFSVLNLVLRPIPGTTVPRSRFTPRELQEHDVTDALRWFNRKGFPDATKNTLQDAMHAVARQTVISPVRHYLESLKWDGVLRIGEWLQTYCEAPSEELVRRFGRAWLVAAVARALRPGCKADNALVLEGPQGAGKSSALKALAGEEWFFDGLRDMHGKDASAGLRGKWIIELPELSALRRSDAEAVKAFLSRTEERYRPAYGRSEVLERRRCIFAGTTNRGDYLADDTGGRRFWPVPVGKVDVAGLKRDRGQIWAEAVAAFRAGEPWWLSAEDEAGAAQVVAERQAEDPWSGKVLTLVAGLREVSTSQIFEMMEIPLERRSRAESMRIGGVLTRAGWMKDGKFKGGPYRDTTRYLPPKVGSAA